MAVQALLALLALSEHFQAFFTRLNPSPSFERRAASEHQSIVRLIEVSPVVMGTLAPRCFLQGSYRQQTAIYTINDVDIVALCQVRPSLGLWLWEAQRWRRDEIFDTLAAPLQADPRYKGKIRYGSGNMCIKVDVGIRVELLPVVYHSPLAGFEADYEREPFLLFRPERNRWEAGYARSHRRRLSDKNHLSRTAGNFIPSVKVFKHLRTLHDIDAVSFHLECLLYGLPDRLFRGSPATYIPALLRTLASSSAEDWYARTLSPPCGERRLFSRDEWDWPHWQTFHNHIVYFNRLAQAAQCAPSRLLAIQAWQLLLGEGYFPKNASA